MPSPRGADHREKVVAPIPPPPRPVGLGHQLCLLSRDLHRSTQSSSHVSEAPQNPKRKGKKPILQWTCEDRHELVPISQRVLPVDAKNLSHAISRHLEH